MFSAFLAAKRQKADHSSQQIVGRTFGVQSLRSGSQNFLKSISALRKADAGGAAVAFAVSKSGLYLIALVLGRFQPVFRPFLGLVISLIFVCSS